MQGFHYYNAAKSNAAGTCKFSSSISLWLLRRPKKHVIGSIFYWTIAQVCSSPRCFHSTVDNVKNSFDTKNDEKRLQQVVVMDFNRPGTIVQGLKNVDKLFVLTPTHPKMVEFTSNLKLRLFFSPFHSAIFKCR
jgi:hypothetical protein